MIFYKLLLEKESLHHFKRYYLLSALVLSISIPLITFTEYVEGAAITNTHLETAQLTFEETNGSASWKDFVPNILWIIYSMGVVLFSFRFAINLGQLLLRIKNNPKLQDKNITKVLLLDNISPHTFFKYIFLNKTKYESNAIPNEVLLHEQTHAEQLHALDILLIEIVQIIFWFNPLLFLLKKDIKLNHEFLADRAVLNQNISELDYQNILLAFSSNAVQPQLANAINYSLIKKRFAVMKTQTSKTATWIRSLVLLPLLAFMVYGFSSTKEVVKYSDNVVSETSNHTARSIEINVLDNNTYLVDGLKANRNSLVSVVNQLHQDITPEIRNNIMNIHVSSVSGISAEETWFIFEALKPYGFHRMVTPNEEIVKSKGNTPMRKESLESNVNVLEKDVDNAEKNILKIQTEATAEEVAEYNKLAEQFNYIMKQENVRFEMEDVERLKYLYNKMSTAQRKSAVPFPDFPEPPPPPDAPKIAEKVNTVLPPPPPPIPDNATPEQRKKYEKAIKDYKVKAAKLEKEKNKQLKERQMAERKAISEEQKVRIASSEAQRVELAEARVQRERQRVVLVQERKRLEKERRAEVVKREALQKEEVRRRKDETRERINTSPPPRNPIDHVVDMAKKGASFYLEGNPISSDLAVETIKSNKKISVETINADSSQPKVYITTGSPVVKN